MTILNAAGDALLIHYEGDKLVAYLDIAGVWTIGRGHTGPEVHAGLVWTQAQSDEAYAKDKARVIEEVDDAVHGMFLNENQLAGCVVLTFNIGGKAFASSEVCANINAGDFNAAAKCFVHWDHAHVNGQLVEVDGLLRRRLAESHLFLTPPDHVVVVPQPVVEIPIGGVIPEAVPPVTITTAYSPSSEISGAAARAAPPPVGTLATVGTVVAGAAGAVQQSIDRLQPVHDGLLAMGMEPSVIAYGLGALLLATLGYLGVTHYQARKVGRG